MDPLNPTSPEPAPKKSRKKPVVETVAAPEPAHLPERVVEQIARVAHEANRTYCLTIGDGSQPEWADAPDWQKNSVRNGVKFHAANPNASASDSHDAWLEEKRKDGWKYGPVKDPAKKEHPCFVPYEELPLNQRLKDYLFRAVVHALIPNGK